MGLGILLLPLLAKIRGAFCLLSWVGFLVEVYLLWGFFGGCYFLVACKLKALKGRIGLKLIFIQEGLLI